MVRITLLGVFPRRLLWEYGLLHYRLWWMSWHNRFLHYGLLHYSDLLDGELFTRDGCWLRRWSSPSFLLRITEAAEEVAFRALVVWASTDAELLITFNASLLGRRHYTWLFTHTC